MRRVLRLIILPAYNTARHGFLFGMWWWRLLVVLYAPVIAFWGPWRWMTEVGLRYDACLARDRLLSSNGINTIPGIEMCSEFARQLWLEPMIIWPAFAAPFLVHYLGQFVVFKVVVYFIALGGRTAPPSSPN
jgi:hypothetical protein